MKYISTRGQSPAVGFGAALTQGLAPDGGLYVPEAWPTIPLAALIRMFVIGSVAVLGSIWALWRHYNVPRMPMVVPVTSSASEIEVEPP